MRFNAGPDRSGGFTLVEILVVVALLAIAAGAVVPHLASDRGSQRLRASAVSIADALAFCYSSAVTEDRRYRWVWLGDERQWRILHEADPRNRPGEFVEIIAAGQAGETLPERIEMAGLYRPVFSADALDSSRLPSAPELNFHPDGHCDHAMIVLHLTPRAGDAVTQGPLEALTISLNGFSGQARLLKGDAVNTAGPATSSLLLGGAA